MSAENLETPRRYRLGAMAGDGIGNEVVGAAVAVVNAAAELHGVAIEWIWLPMGWNGIEECGSPMPDETVRGLQECDGWVMGPHDSESYPEQFRSAPTPSGVLRQTFDLYANLRPCRTQGELQPCQRSVDMLIVRENLEGFYADRNMFKGQGELMPSADTALCIGVFTRQGIERIAQAAIEAAHRRRRKLTVIHKANVLRMTSGLFLDVCRSVASHTPEVTIDDMHVDAAASIMVRNPEQFDVVVTENMFGDILSNLGAEIAGGLGSAGSINRGDRWAMAQAAHGAAPTIAGRDVANPTGEILSASYLLEWLGIRCADERLMAIAARIQSALDQLLRTGVRTIDIGGQVGTQEFTDALLGTFV